MMSEGLKKEIEDLQKDSNVTNEAPTVQIEKKYEDPVQQEYYERAVKHNQLIDEKRKADYKYYGEKLTKMCQDTISVITPETTPEELANYLKIGNKEYLDMIAKARQTRKYLKLNINAYMQCMIEELQRRMILTKKKSIEEVHVTPEDVAKEISNQEQNENDMLSTANSVDMGELHKEVIVDVLPSNENEEDKINNIPQDMVENNNVEENEN